MSAIITEIKSVLKEIKPDASLIHGRSFDSALDTHIQSTEVAYVYIDPIIKRGTISDGKQLIDMSIGFIKQDAPDGSVEEMEAIVDDMEALAINFLKTFFDRNIMENGDVLMFDTYNISPIYRIKNVCTGVLVTFTATASISC